MIPQEIPLQQFKTIVEYSSSSRTWYTFLYESYKLLSSYEKQKKKSHILPDFFWDSAKFIFYGSWASLKIRLGFMHSDVIYTIHGKRGEASKGGNGGIGPIPLVEMAVERSVRYYRQCID